MTEKHQREAIQWLRECVPEYTMSAQGLAALAKLEADAQALADVRTLDEWAGERGQHQWAIERYRGTWRVKVCTSNGVQLLPEGATPDEARAKAAAWVREQKP